MGKRYFITGATGYLGSRLIQHLSKNEDSFFCTRRNSSNTFRLAKLESRINWIYLDSFQPEIFFENNEIDAVIHCATNYGRKEVSPIETIDANLTLPLRILHSAAAAGVATFINTDTILDKGVDSYTLSKRQFVEWLQRYSARVATVNVSLQHFYGPGDDRSKFITGLIRALLKPEDRIKLTRGAQKRDFIFIDDVISAFEKILIHSDGLSRGFHSYEVGSGKAVTLKDFIETAKALSNNHKTQLDFGALPYRTNEVMDTQTDLRNLKALGWSPVWDVERGLRETIESERGLIL